MVSWERARAALRDKVGERDFETWIRPLRVSATEDGKVHVGAPSKFYRDWVNRHFLDALRTSFHAAGDEPPEVILKVEESLQGELFGGPDVAEASTAPARTAARVGNLVPHYTFENFVVGSSNQFAHAAARAVADHPGERYNPLFVYGWVGVGKTHLVNAIGHAILRGNPLAKIVYVPSESFVNDMISSLRRDRMEEFKLRFRKVDLLIIDDVQFLGGRERTQEEFFHTFNSLHERHRQIVLTSDKSPKDIPGLEERLRNRFEWGLAADVQAPEMETRIAILQKKAEAVGFALPPEVASFIASEITTNVRELEGALTRLGAMASLHSAELTVPFARSVLGNHLRVQVRKVTIEDVQRTVCEHFGLSLVEMTSKRRSQNVSAPRQIAMYLARKLANASFPVIGHKFGGRDHSTVIHANTAVARRIDADPSLRSTIQGLERTLQRNT